MRPFETLFLSLLAFWASTEANCVDLLHSPRQWGHYPSLLWYNKTSYKSWVNQIDQYLKPYTHGIKLPCNYKNPPEPGKVCKFKSINWGPCTPSNNYGYANGSPCVFIELRKTLDWKPKYYNSTKHLPKDMPESLKETLKDIEADGLKSEWETVWLTCDGQYPGDRETVGPIKYYPFQGYPGFLFQYSNRKGSLNPIIAVHFEKPQRGMVVSVFCKVWAANIKSTSRRGEANFQFLIDI